MKNPGARATQLVRLLPRIEDVDAYAAKAQELGGNVMVPPTVAGEVGKFSVIQDPQGGAFSRSCSLMVQFQSSTRTLDFSLLPLVSGIRRPASANEKRDVFISCHLVRNW